MMSPTRAACGVGLALLLGWCTLAACVSPITVAEERVADGGISILDDAESRRFVADAPDDSAESGESLDASSETGSTDNLHDPIDGS